MMRPWHDTDALPEPPVAFDLSEPARCRVRVPAAPFDVPRPLAPADVLAVCQEAAAHRKPYDRPLTFGLPRAAGGGALDAYPLPMPLVARLLHAPSGGGSRFAFESLTWMGGLPDWSTQASGCFAEVADCDVSAARGPARIAQYDGARRLVRVLAHNLAGLPASYRLEPDDLPF